MKSQRYEHYLGFTSWFGFLRRSLRKSIKQLQDHLEKVEDSNTNNLQLESLNSDSVWESYGVWKLRKLERKNIDSISQFFFLETNGGNWRDLKRKEEGHFCPQKMKTRPAFPWVGCVSHTRPESWLGRVAHGLHMWKTCLGLWPPNFSRAPLTFFSRIRASELRFRIRFRITNCDSLMHDEDYETLTNGWEFISEIDDEHC